MVLTNEEIEAVENSIEHWKKDIRDRLLKKDIIVISTFPYIWASSKKIVEMYDNECSLCTLSKPLGKMERIPHCSRCAYYKKYGYFCTDTNHGDWERFRMSPTLKNCNNMIKKLKDILKD